MAAAAAKVTSEDCVLAAATGCVVRSAMSTVVKGRSAMTAAAFFSSVAMARRSRTVNAACLVPAGVPPALLEAGVCGYGAPAREGDVPAAAAAGRRADDTPTRTCDRACDEAAAAALDAAAALVGGRPGEGEAPAAERAAASADDAGAAAVDGAAANSATDDAKPVEDAGAEADMREPAAEEDMAATGAFLDGHRRLPKMTGARWSTR